jgi:subtilisin
LFSISIGASVLDLSEEEAERLRADSRVAEVVEDREVHALGGCGCGGGQMGTAHPGEIGQAAAGEHFAAGYRQAMQDYQALLMSQAGPAAVAASSVLAGGMFPVAALPCPTGYRRVCLPPSVWYPYSRCFCVPGQAPSQQAVGWNIQMVRANEVWSRVMGDGVNVAVIDTGIDQNHPDLTVSGGASFVPGVAGWDDDQGHGTHCAGIIAARNNAVGVVGVAPKASLFAVKVLNDRGSGLTSWILAGMGWAARSGMHVASMSLGSTPETADEPCILAYQRAAEELIASGCIVIAAAGNSGRTERPWVGHPARCPGFMAVAAVDQDRNLADFSSRGPASLPRDCAVEIAAPGVSVNSTVRGGGYAEKSGTSMATPHVAGAAALLKEQHPTWTPAEIRARLRATAIDLGTPGDDPGTGSGLLDCYRAILG